MLMVVTVVHTPSPLAEHLPNAARRTNGYARAADKPETPATAPEAADWLRSPNEQSQAHSIQQMLENWRTEPRWTPPPPNSDTESTTGVPTDRSTSEGWSS